MPTLITKSKLGLAASVLSMSVASAVYADDGNRGFMIGAGLYYGLVSDKVDISDDFDFSDIKIDDSSAAYNFMAGYRINNWLAVDGGYWNLGEYSSDRLPNGDKLKSEATAWTLGGIASVPLWILDVYGRAGVAWWETSTSGGADDDSTDWYYGLGAAFNLGGSIDLYAEWVRFDLGSDVNADIDLLGVGVRWTF